MREIKLFIFAALLLFGFVNTGLAEQKVQDLAIELDREYQQLAVKIYRAQANHAATFNNLELLWEAYQSTISEGNTVTANSMVRASLDLFSTQPEHILVTSFVDVLLQRNERQMAETIYARVEAANALDALSSLDYIFAKYYARQRDWLQVNRLLAQISINMVPEDAEYAHLLQGLSLQFLKKHRESIESYDAIPKDSAYFVHARLNTALANIRQGWTTQAQTIINDLIPVSRNRNKIELTNRMFVILGYALLQREYFRDARDAFSNVSSDSAYINRALFGTALSAVSQGDLQAGLSAVKLLKQSEMNDLSRDEAHLLLPYIHERLGQTLAVEDGFLAAIKHFQARIQELEAFKNRHLNFTEVKLEDSGKVNLKGLRLDYSQRYPPYLLTNRHNLEQISTQVSDADLAVRIGNLVDQYDQLLKRIITSLLNQQIAYLDSYLNQARYGLARHYDNQNRERE